MIENVIESAFCVVLDADPQLTTVNFFTALDDGAHKLPAITVIAKTESLAGSATICRADVEIRVENHATSATPGEHASIVSRVYALLGDKPQMLAALNGSDEVQILGYALVGSGQDTNDEKFVTVINLKAGCRSLTN